nr:Sec-independent protein translocase subunit TatA [Gilliamella mensalis]
MMSFSIPHLLVFLAVVILLFGTKKLRNLGSDLGTALKGFKKAMNDDEVESKQDDKLDNK